jgi:MFS family permease
LLLAPAMLGITVSTTLSGRSIARTGRYKRFPVAGLALMSIALALLAMFAADPSALTVGLGLVLFGLGFGMVTQVLITAVQNTVERRELGIAMAVTGFFRGLGGAVGAAILGAVFATQAGSGVSDAGGSGLATAVRSDVIDGVQGVFVVAAPLAALGLLLVLALPESPLRTQTQTPPEQEADRSQDAVPRSRPSEPAGNNRLAMR